MSKVTTDVLQKFLYTVRVVDFTERVLYVLLPTAY